MGKPLIFQSFLYDFLDLAALYQEDLTLSIRCCMGINLASIQITHIQHYEPRIEHKVNLLKY